MSKRSRFIQIAAALILLKYATVVYA